MPTNGVSRTMMSVLNEIPVFFIKIHCILSKDYKQIGILNTYVNVMQIAEVGIEG